MKVFRWILSNLLLLVVVWTLVYAYLNWDELKHDMPESVNNLIARFQPDAQEPADVTESDVMAQAVDSVSQDPMGVVGQPEISEAAEAVEPTSSLDVSTWQAVEPAEVPDIPEVEVVMVAPDAGAQDLPPQTPATELDEAPAPADVLSEDPGAAQRHTLDDAARSELIMAREAFWHRDLIRAETLYTELAQRQSDNPDLWGELGNVYLAQNKITDAADAYYNAAEILIDEGRIRQIGRLMAVIQVGNPEKARGLDEKMRNLYR